MTGFDMFFHFKIDNLPCLNLFFCYRHLNLYLGFHPRVSLIFFVVFKGGEASCHLQLFEIAKIEM